MKKSSAATSPKRSSIHGDDDEQTEQYQPWGGNDGPPQDDYEFPNGVDYEDDAGPQTGPEDVGQLPTEQIPKLPSNIAGPALSNVIHRQSQMLPTPVSASRVPSNHTDEPVMKPQYPHISEVKLHWSQFADPCADSQVPFCKPHAQGACYIGDACYFRHSLTIQEYVALFHDQQPTLVTLRKQQDSDPAMSPAPTKAVFYQASVPAPTMAPCASIQPTTNEDSQHVQATRPSTFPQECKFYPIGKCRNGNRCPYSHTNHPPPELMNTSVSDGDLGDSAPYTTDRPKMPCRYFAEGRCSNAEHCKFLHENTSEPRSDTPSARTSENNAWSQQEDNRWEIWEGGGSGWDGGSATDANKESWNPAPDDSAWFAPSNKSNGYEGHHSKSSPHESRKPPCHMYERRGYCRYGDSCKFAHDEPVIPDDDQVANIDEWPSTNQDSSTTVEEPPSGSESLSPQGRAAPDSGVENQNSKPAAESSVKTNWEPNTDDNNGWATEWTQDTGTSDLPPAKINAYCKEFGRGVGCKWGDVCRFIHDDPNSIVSVSNGDIPQVSKRHPFPA